MRYLASQPWPFPGLLMIGCQGQAASVAITPAPAEIEEARWLTREQVLAVHAGEDRTILPARKGTIAKALLGMWLADRLD